MITKKRFIDLALIQISGGKPTSATSVQYADLEAYLPYICNKVNLDQYYLNIKDEAYRDVPGAFLATMDNLTLTFDNVKASYYVTLPYQPIPLPRNGGIRFVGFPSGEAFVGGIENSKALYKYSRKHANGVTRTEYIGDRIYFYNLPLATQPIMVRVVANPEQLTDDAYLPIPGGMEAMAMDMLVQFGKGERFLPKNDIQNGTDMVSQVNGQ